MNKETEKRYYFDWAASAPTIVTGPFSLYGNPSSQHSEGKAAKLALEDARNRCACVLNVPPQTLYFTSGGTESNSIAILSNLLRKGQGRIISSAAEHSSVREGMETLEKLGKPTGIIAVDSDGRVNVKNLEKAFEKYGDVRFCSIMAVNNEIGSITDIPSLKDVMRKQKGNVHFHCDLVQAIGKIPVDIQNWNIDSASISAHKICGPKGIGLLYLRSSNLEVLYKGGGQENGIRGGTENIQGAVALAECLEKYASPQVVKENYKLALNRWNRLVSSLLATGRCVIIPQNRARGDLNKNEFSPYILQAAFKGIPGEVMARALDDLGFAVSTGSACSSTSPERPVLLAMGVEESLRIEGIRISQGYSTTDEEIDALVNAVSEVLKFL
jgi:cysteine desulfurase